jgi:hypothetical protein
VIASSLSLLAMTTPPLVTTGLDPHSFSRTRRSALAVRRRSGIAEGSECAAIPGLQCVIAL